MSETTMTKALVFTILRHAEDFPWRMQDIGLMGLRLDDVRQYRLHVWNPSLSADDPPIHDHPYDFTSAIIVGELTDTRYVENAAGDEHIRLRYSLPNEEQRRSDTVRLSRRLKPSVRATSTVSSPMSSTRAGNSRGRRHSFDAHGVWHVNSRSVCETKPPGGRDELGTHTRGNQIDNREGSGEVLDPDRPIRGRD